MSLLLQKIINFIPLFAFLVVSVGIVPSEHFIWILLFSTSLYIGIFFYYEKLFPVVANKLPLLQTLILYVTLACSSMIFVFFRVDPVTYPNDPRDYHVLAQNIVKFGIYGQETTVDGKTVVSPSAYRPVGYPLFLAFVYYVTGTFNYKFVVLVQFLCHLFSIIFFWKIVRAYYSEKIADVATVLYALNLPLLFISNIMLSETITQFIVLLIIYIILQNILNNKPTTRGMSIGILSSLLVLTRVNYLLYLPIILYFLYRKSGKKTALFFSITAVLIFGLWGIRNYRHSGKFIFTSTNGGINMYLGNNSYVLNGRASTWPPKEEVEKVTGSVEDAGSSAKLQSGAIYDGIEKEVVYNSAFGEAAVDWIISNFGTFIKLVFSRLSFLFIPQKNLFSNLEYLNNPARYQYYFLLLMQSVYFWTYLFLTLVGVTDKKHKWLVFLSIPYLSVFLISFADTRFQIPLYIPMSIFAAFGLKRLLNFRKSVGWLILASIIFLIQFSIHKNDYNNVLRYFGYYTKVARAETKLNNSLIKKVYSEEVYLHARLKNKYDGVTLDPDILSYVSDTEGVLLIYKDTEESGLPVFELEKTQNFEFTNITNVATNIAATRPNINTLILRQEISGDLKFIRLLVILYKFSSIEINGTSSIIIESFPVEADYIRTSLLIPRSFFGNGIEIFLYSSEFPLDPSRVPIDKTFQQVWEPGFAVLESVDLVY